MIELRRENRGLNRGLQYGKTVTHFFKHFFKHFFNNIFKNIFSVSFFLMIILVSGLVSGLLSGCTGMNSSFACDGTASGNCQTLDQVNTLADEGYYRTQESDGAGKGHGEEDQTQSFSYDSSQEGGAVPALLQGQHQVGEPLPGEPIRYGETVQRIWIAPYMDTQGDYNEPSYLYAVVQPGHWIGVPQQEITSEDN